MLDPRVLLFVDSTGLHLLLRLATEARESSHAFALLDCDGPLRRLLELTLLDDRFERVSDDRLGAAARGAAGD